MSTSAPLASAPRTAPRELRLQAVRGEAARTITAAVLDQGLFATANFAVNLLLGAWLAPASYGAFATSFALFLLAGGIYNALITEPMMVFGAALERKELDRYLSELTLMHLGLCGAFGVLLAALAAVLPIHGPLPSNLLAMAAVQPMLFYPWLLRRICYLYQRPYVAAEGGAVCLSTTLLLLIVAYRARQMSVALAFLIQAAGAAIATVYLCRRLGAFPLPGASPETLRKHWSYGRWTLAAALIGWIPGNVAYLLLPLAAGLEANGAYKAVMNLVMPQLQGIGSLSNVLIPSFTRALRRSPGALRTAMRTSLLWLTGLSLASGGLLFGARRALLGWLYGGRYVAYFDVVPSMALLPLAIGVTIVCGAMVRACRKPWGLVLANAAGAVFALTGGVFLIERYGVGGAAAAYAAASGITAASLYLFSMTGAER